MREVLGGGTLGLSDQKIGGALGVGKASGGELVRYVKVVGLTQSAVAVRRWRA